MKKILILLIASSLFLTSCSPDEENVVIPPKNEDVSKAELLLLKKVTRTYSGGFLNTQEFEYDDQKRVSLRTQTNYHTITTGSEQHVEERISYTRYEYNDNTYIQIGYEPLYETEWSSKFIRISDEETRREGYSNGKLVSSASIYYSGNDCGASSVETIYNNEKKFVDIEYIDSNCSAIERAYDSDDILLYEHEFIRSGNFSPFASHTQENSFEQVSLNNIIESILKDADGNIDQRTSWRATKEVVNSKNYPISETKTYFNGDYIDSTYEYY